MLGIIFRRFDRTAKMKDFVYQNLDDVRHIEFDMQAISMDKMGFNIHTSIKNYMAETILLGGNLGSEPKRIHSLVAEGTRQRDDARNMVIITIFSSENEPGRDYHKNRSKVTKTEIKIPGRMLSQGSVFIDELDCYIGTESNVDATRELIAKDSSRGQWDSISLPGTMAKQDPETLYFSEFSELVKDTIDRQDKIHIRTGYDIRYGIVPDIIKSMRVSILDSYFVPYKDYKLEFDPDLGVDEFVIDNLLLSSRNQYRSTFTHLKAVRSIYVDANEVTTLLGRFYGMAVFADELAYTNYVYKRKAVDRFDDEMLYVAERSGDPKLKEDLEELQREKDLLTQDLSGKTEELEGLRARLTRLKQDLRDREATITQISKNHDASFGTEAVLGSIANERSKLVNESEKISLDREELQHRTKTSILAHRAQILKTIGDILKSGWGIVTGCIAGIFAVIALCKKYNVKITMSA